MSPETGVSCIGDICTVSASCRCFRMKPECRLNHRPPVNRDYFRERQYQFTRQGIKAIILAAQVEVTLLCHFCVRNHSIMYTLLPLCAKVDKTINGEFYSSLHPLWLKVYLSRTALRSTPRLF